ncbi:ATP-binding protein [Melioribacteraceae bacterium 4301-Me]|uniref:hybrid sensor histidine kinase/response regulator n=1 Tax=Pyranulibacter aquaticus TaxID=3163344 RepID=UPI00359A7F19
MANSNNYISLLNYFTEGFTEIFYSIKKNDKEYFTNTILPCTGYTEKEILELPSGFFSIVFPEDQEKVEKSLAEINNNLSKSNFELEYRIQTKDGKIKWLKEFIHVVRNKSGKIQEQKSLYICNNNKNNENELQKAYESLKELNASKDKFISIVSHDLKAPFTTLLGFSEILLNEKDLSEEEKEEYLKYIYEASKSQLQLINCLLDWSRLKTGRVKIEPVRLNVKVAVANAITPLTGDSIRKNIEIKQDIPPEFNINADERLFGQAIFNLVSNAIKFTPEGKRIYISSQRFKEGVIEIIVKDEGVGIAEENYNKLFRIDEKFVLAGTTGEKGSGMGLTLVKEIVEKHGGKVWFYSQLNEGSEFHLTFPEAKNVILIVEADEKDKLLLKNIIEREFNNFEISYAKNGYEAISAFQKIIPTIIITEHDMKLMNGIQLIEAVHNKEANYNISFIVTANTLTEETRRKYERLGVQKIITKPVDEKQLVDAINNCLFNNL